MACILTLVVFIIIVVVAGTIYQMVNDLKHHAPLDKWSLVLISVALIFAIFCAVTLKKETHIIEIESPTICPHCGAVIGTCAIDSVQETGEIFTNHKKSLAN